MRYWAALALGLFATTAFAQQATQEAQVGFLNCRVEGGVGFIIGSRKDLTCSFLRADGLANETYTGRISKYGVDIGQTEVSDLSWAVFAPSRAVSTTGRLAGTYGGVTAEATAGLGLGANALLGGFEKSIALQPLSLQVQRGINIAAGIAALELVAVPASTN